jgi:hypothetical protein
LLDKAKISYILKRREYFVMQCLGPAFDGYVYLSADDTRVGILLAWDTSVVEISHVSFDTYAITGEVKRLKITTGGGLQRSMDHNL